MNECNSAEFFTLQLVYDSVFENYSHCVSPAELQSLWEPKSLQGPTLHFVCHGIAGGYVQEWHRMKNCLIGVDFRTLLDRTVLGSASF